MIVGTIDARRNLLISLAVRGFAGQELEIVATLDTGFSDWLSLIGRPDLDSLRKS